MIFSTDLETKDENNNLICRNQLVIFAKNHGGFGGSIQTDNIVEPIYADQKIRPSYIMSEKIPLGQAALYRLK
jgi:hypothetical protein